MINKKSILAIIPARGGSKRLPRKNTLPINGKPLIYWTIKAALKSQYIDKIVISSDDHEVKKLSSFYNVDFIDRPKELSLDDSTTISVVMHAFEKLGAKYDYIILLQPTSPLRNSRHIDEAISLLNKKRSDAIISVCEVGHPPIFTNKIPLDGSMEKFITNEMKNKRTQDFPQFYKINGAIYICCINRLFKEETFFIKDNIFSYIMSKEKSIDIDDEFDFKLAQYLFNS